MEKFPYDDILNYKYPNPEIEKDFPEKVLRAAQFAPFAALTGHGEAIDETARLTCEKIELDDYEKEVINGRLAYIGELLGERNADVDCVKVSVKYFVPDERKSGGMYRYKRGDVLKLREFERSLIFSDGTKVSVDDIAELCVCGDEYNDGDNN